MKRFLPWVASLLLATATANEQHHPNRDWEHIEVPGFDIVYPEGLEEEARYVAERLNTYWPELEGSLPLDTAPRRIPILISSPTLISNGAVSYDPVHSIFYNRPAPLGGLEWFDILSVHEGRHLVQVHQPLDTLTGRIAYAFAGEYGPGAIILLFYPQWLLEGDAVVSETVLTEGGRGRVASFELWLRTHELTQERYSYDRAMLGTGFESYPTVSPYDLGYFMTSYLRRTHGDGILDKALARTANPDHALTFNGAVHGLTGKGLDATYHRAWDDLLQRWQQQVDSLDPTRVDPLWQPEGDHWHSLYPIGTDADRILAVEMDVEDGSYLVALEKGEVERLKRLPRRVAADFYSVAKQRSVSYAAGTFCWTDRATHPRFALEVGADIQCYTETDKTLTTLTRNGAFTNIGLARDAQSLLAHRFTEQRHSQLVLLNRNGRELAARDLPPRSVAYDLTPDGSGGWVFVLLDGEGVRFMNWRADTNDLVELTAPVKGESLRSPQMSANWLIYTSDRSGIDSVWAMNRESGQRFQVTQRPFGNYFVNLDAANNRLVFTDYTAHGHQVVSLPWFDPQAPLTWWLPSNQLNTRPTAYSAPLQRPVPESTGPVAAAASPYHRWANAWSLNRWQLLGDNDELTLHLHSNNLLNTLTVDTFAGAHFGAGTAIGGVTVNWRQWWPVLGLSAERRVSDEDETLDSGIGVNASLPLISTQGLWTTVITPNVGTRYTDRESIDNGQDWQSTLVNAGVTFNRIHEAAPRDLQAPYALASRYDIDLELETDRIQQYNYSQLNLPGFAANHHLTLSSQWQDRQSGFTGPGRYLRPTAFDDLVMGAPALDARLNYRFSLGPVDASLGRLWYLRSLELGLDARWMNGVDESHSAIGPQLTLPSNLFRNSLLRLNPTFSLYYRPTTEDLKWTFGFTLNGT